MTTGHPARASTTQSGSPSDTNRESIGSLELGDGLAHGRVQVGGTGQVMMYAVRDHFGIGFRIEAIAKSMSPSRSAS